MQTKILFLYIACFFTFFLAQAQTPNKLLFNHWQVTQVKFVEGFTKNPEKLQKIMQKFQFNFVDNQKLAMVNPTLQNPNQDYELKFSDANNFVATEITESNPKTEFQFKITKITKKELVLEDQRQQLKGTIWTLKPLK